MHPKVTVGVPAFNNAATIAVVLEALLNQRFSDFSVVVSDDGSTDDTVAICEEYRRKDRRISVVRQPVNLRYQNFGYLLRSAATDMFMWAAGDDRLEPEYLQECVSALDRNRDAVLAVSQVEFFEDEGSPARSTGTYCLVDSPGRNVARYLAAPGDNSRMYGVFRTEPGRRSFPSRSFHAYDWAFSAATLRYGVHLEVPSVLLRRRRTPRPAYVQMVRHDAGATIDRLLPLRPMSSWLLAEGRVPRTPAVLNALVTLNLNKHLEYCQLFHPKYARFARRPVRFWDRHLAWRLRDSA